jgi:hypothetical protein
MVTVLAVAPLLATLHRASVRHAICEHGDLIEPDPGSLRPETSSAAVEAVASRGLGTSGFSRLRGDSAPIVHTHDHCPVATLAKAGVGVGASRSFTVALLHASASNLPCGESPPARPVLSNAPKTSPPRSPVSIFA